MSGKSEQTRSFYPQFTTSGCSEAPTVLTATQAHTLRWAGPHPLLQGSGPHVTWCSVAWTPLEANPETPPSGQLCRTPQQVSFVPTTALTSCLPSPFESNLRAVTPGPTGERVVPAQVRRKSTVPYLHTLPSTAPTPLNNKEQVS